MILTQKLKKSSTSRLLHKTANRISETQFLIHNDICLEVQEIHKSEIYTHNRKHNFRNRIISTQRYLPRLFLQNPQNHPCQEVSEIRYLWILQKIQI